MSTDRLERKPFPQAQKAGQTEHGENGPKRPSSKLDLLVHRKDFAKDPASDAIEVRKLHSAFRDKLKSDYDYHFKNRLAEYKPGGSRAEDEITITNYRALEKKFRALNPKDKNLLFQTYRKMKEQTAGQELEEGHKNLIKALNGGEDFLKLQEVLAFRRKRASLTTKINKKLSESQQTKLVGALAGKDLNSKETRTALARMSGGELFLEYLDLDKNNPKLLAISNYIDDKTSSAKSAKHNSQKHRSFLIPTISSGEKQKLGSEFWLAREPAVTVENGELAINPKRGNRIHSKKFGTPHKLLRPDSPYKNLSTEEKLSLGAKSYNVIQTKVITVQGEKAYMPIGAKAVINPETQEPLVDPVSKIVVVEDLEACPTIKKLVVPPTNLNGIIFKQGQTNINNIDFRRADLTEMQAKHSQGRYDLRDAKGIGVHFGSAGIDDSKLDDADFPWLNLHNASAAEVHAEGTKMPGAIVKQGKLTEADFSSAHALFANWQGADLYKTKLLDGNMEYGNFSPLKKANGERQVTNLKRADLTRTKLGGSNLSGANIEGATLDKAKMGDVIMDGTTGYGQRGPGDPEISIHPGYPVVHDINTDTFIPGTGEPGTDSFVPAEKDPETGLYIRK